MKNLILTIGLILTTLFSFAQNKKPKKIIIEIKKSQNINWPSNISLNEAKNEGLVNYPNYVIGEKTYIFDLENHIATKMYDDKKIEFKILKKEQNQFTFYFELEVNTSTINSKIVLTEKEEGGYVFIVQYSSNYGDDKLEGFFSQNDDLTIKYGY